MSGTRGAAGCAATARGLQAGDRVPDATLIDARGSEPVALFDLISQGWTLLIFPGDEATPETMARSSGLPGRSAMLLAMRSTRISCSTRPRKRRRGGGVARSCPRGSQRLRSTAWARGSGAARWVPGIPRSPDQPGEFASYLARVFAMQLREAHAAAPSSPSAWRKRGITTFDLSQLPRACLSKPLPSLQPSPALAAGSPASVEMLALHHPSQPTPSKSPSKRCGSGA